MTETVAKVLDRPVTVSLAVKLCYATIGIFLLPICITLPVIVRELWSTTPGNQLPFGILLEIAIVFFGVGVMCFLVYKVGTRRNWARITILIVFIVECLSSLQLHSLPFHPNLFSGLLWSLRSIGEVTALILLFQKSSNEWFRKPKST